LDAKAQYEAVLEAYNKHQDDVNKAEEILSYKRLENRIGQELVQGFDVTYTGNFVTTKKDATGTTTTEAYAGNKRLPQTNEAQSVLSLVGVLLGGTMLLSTKKKED
jgi:LPXTG-motif cell wall anchor domain protein